MGRLFLLFSLLLAMFPAQAGDLYRWVDANGKVRYGDAPPTDAVRVDEMKLPVADAPAESLPYETRRAMKNFPLTLYVADNCNEPCANARELLNKRGIPFTEKKLVTQQEIDTFKAASGSDNAPSLQVGNLYVNGFNAKRWNTELDAAGYPKTAPWRPTVSTPATATETKVSP